MCDIHICQRTNYIHIERVKNRFLFFADFVFKIVHLLHYNSSINFYFNNNYSYSFFSQFWYRNCIRLFFFFSCSYLCELGTYLYLTFLLAVQITTESIHFEILIINSYSFIFITNFLITFMLQLFRHINLLIFLIMFCNCSSLLYN